MSTIFALQLPLRRAVSQTAHHTQHIRFPSHTTQMTAAIDAPPFSLSAPSVYPAQPTAGLSPSQTLAQVSTQPGWDQLSFILPPWPIHPTAAPQAPPVSPAPWLFPPHPPIPHLILTWRTTRDLQPTPLGQGIGQFFAPPNPTLNSHLLTFGLCFSPPYAVCSIWLWFVQHLLCSGYLYGCYVYSMAVCGW